MTDKQKIEEIAMELYNNQDKIDVTNPYEVAELIYKVGYRKVDENHIVIPLDGSKMVIPRKDQQKLLHEMYEQGKFDAIAELQMEGKIIVDEDEYKKLKTNKTSRDLNNFTIAATAKAILDKIYKTLWHGPIMTSNGEWGFDREIVFDLLNELAKQYGVEVEDNGN